LSCINTLNKLIIINVVLKFNTSCGMCTMIGKTMYITWFNLHLLVFSSFTRQSLHSTLRCSNLISLRHDHSYPVPSRNQSFERDAAEKKNEKRSDDYNGGKFKLHCDCVNLYKERGVMLLERYDFHHTHFTGWLVEEYNLTSYNRFNAL